MLLVTLNGYAQPVPSHVPQTPPDGDYIHLTPPRFPRVSDVDPALVRAFNKRFVDAAITPPASAIQALDETEIAILRHLVDAARVMNIVFVKQMHPGTEAFVAEALKSDIPGLRTLVTHVKTFGDDEHTVIPGFHPSPGKNLYPYGLHTRPAIEAVIATQILRHPETRDPLSKWHGMEYQYTVIRLKPDGTLVAIPYSEAYKKEFSQTAGLLERAAALAQPKWPKFAAYLNERAKALRTNDYKESEKLWMQAEPDCPFDVVIGPVESYIDQVLGNRTAVEAHINLNDAHSRTRYATFIAKAKYLDEQLPLSSRPYDLEGKSYSIPVFMGYEVYRAGGNGGKTEGIPAIAYNLPNDPDIREHQGFKITELINVISAKADLLLRPIAGLALHSKHQASINNDVFADIVFFHELSHGIGPQKFKVDGVDRKVQDAMGAIHHPLEELKADIVGMWAALHLMGTGDLPSEKRSAFLATYIASLFRSIRFGADAHGRGSLVQLNFCIENGGLAYDDATHTYKIQENTLAANIHGLAQRVLDLQASTHPDATQVRGAAERFLTTYDKVRPEVQRILDKINDSVPVDLRLSHPIANALARSSSSPKVEDLVRACGQ